MKAVPRSLFNPFDSDRSRLEVDEELRLHLELLTEEHLRPDMTLAEAQEAARQRFGDVDRIKDQCIEISRRHNPLLSTLKAFTLLVFLVGVLVRVFSPELHLTRVGDILIVVGLLGRLFVYVRGLNSSNFMARPETLSPLRLNDKPRPITVYDQRERTPVERVIFDK